MKTIIKNIAYLAFECLSKCYPVSRYLSSPGCQVEKPVHRGVHTFNNPCEWVPTRAWQNLSSF